MNESLGKLCAIYGKITAVAQILKDIGDDWYNTSPPTAHEDLVGNFLKLYVTQEQYEATVAIESALKKEFGHE